MKSNNFLDLIGKKLHEKRPKVPSSFNHTVWIERHQLDTFVQLWFRTRGCRYTNLRGGCTMCDYWISDPVSSDQMVTFVKEGLDTLDFEPTVLLLNASGSVFDDWEVHHDARQKIFKLLSKFQKTTFVFETHANTISESKIVECTNILGKQKIEIELGLESADPWIQKYCINKIFEPHNFANAIQTLKKCGVESSVNILIGTPFLSVSEVINDVVFSINWAFAQGVDRCVLFPMNIKPWTLVYWLEEHGIYTSLSLWTLIEIVSRLEPKILPQIDIAWYKTRPQFHPEYQIPNRGPMTCSKCYDSVVQLLEGYFFSDNRANLIEQLDILPCTCKDRWRKQLDMKPRLTLYERVKTGYEVMGKEILGKQWWLQHGKKVLSDIPNITRFDS